MTLERTTVYQETQFPQNDCITGQYIAKNKRDKHARAWLAVAARDGHQEIRDLTTAQLARLFRTSAYLINEAGKSPLARPREWSLAEMFARSSSAERREMARAAGVDLIWDECVAPLIAE